MATEQQQRTAEHVARAYFEAIAARDLDGAVGHWSADGIEDIVPLRVFRGHDEIRGFLASFAEALPDGEMTVGRVVADERTAVVEWRLSGSFSGAPLEGIDPTGSHVELRGVDCVEVEDGLIVRNTAYYDGMEFARAVGLLPQRDSGAERAMKTAFNGASRVRALVRNQMGG